MVAHTGLHRIEALGLGSRYVRDRQGGRGNHSATGCQGSPDEVPAVFVDLRQLLRGGGGFFDNVVAMAGTGVLLGHDSLFRKRRAPETTPGNPEERGVPNRRSA